MLYLVQMSDFHFGAAGYTCDRLRNLLMCMSQKISAIVPEGSSVVLCLCGNYISSSFQTQSTTQPITEADARGRYSEALNVISDTLIAPLGKINNLQVGMCAGNHDNTYAQEMNSFSQKLIGNDIDRSYALHIDPDNVDLVFVNSCSENNCSRGEVDYDQLESILSGLSEHSIKYLFLHHTVMNLDRMDSASIPEAPRLIRLVDQFSIKALFHGQTHGQYITRVGNQGCPIIGVGPVCTLNRPDISPQFNLIKCMDGIMVSGICYQYHADDATIPGSDSFLETDIPFLEDRNQFYGESFSGIYGTLLKHARSKSTLCDLRLVIDADFKTFCEDVNANFACLRELKTSQRDYSYKELAELWEAPEADKNVLYFNHGEYFSSERHPKGIDYVIETLSWKNNICPAVLSTIDPKATVDTPSTGLVPCLQKIQFSLNTNRDTLLVALDFRNLELSRFLKIGICEVAYLSSILCKAFSFQKIRVTISALHAQIQENFGCFLRARIDAAGLGVMAVALDGLSFDSFNQAETEKRIQLIIDLLQDKRQRSETVVITTGLETLHHAVHSVLPFLETKPERRARLNTISHQISDLLTDSEKLKKLLTAKDDLSPELKLEENFINVQYDLLIQSFQQLIKSGS